MITRTLTVIDIDIPNWTELLKYANSLKCGIETARLLSNADTLFDPHLTLLQGTNHEQETRKICRTAE